MKSRDEKGRFSKKNDNEDAEFVIKFPSIKILIYYAILTVIFLPWIIIISKMKIIEKAIYFVELLLNGFNGQSEDIPENGKKKWTFLLDMVISIK